MLNPYREVKRLLALVQELSTEKLLLQERVDHAQQEADRWFELAKEARTGEREALQMLANFRLQPLGVTPFPEAIKLPESLEPHDMPSIKRSMTPSEAVARATKNFKNQMVERLVADANKH